MNNIKSKVVIALIIISGSLVGNVSIYYDIIFISGFIFLIGIVTYFMKKAEKIVSETVAEGTIEELNQCLKEIENSEDFDKKTKNNLIKEIKQKIAAKHNTKDLT
ncbi:hypothetical protein PQO03_08820 [Lentisphaera profundi]|uniref:Uncharacterized protein n=1 Tax=Lentisphaera profundi TaxID=1658616 RepID=A0ABY7VSJ6_9BACT|nr:hypothetical protein [Lentisphaera profundi]WDE95816.1 hypothetical protein PQO03_08820 [Lentisphaera profundi]